MKSKKGRRGSTWNAGPKHSTWNAGPKHSTWRTGPQPRMAMKPTGLDPQGRFARTTWWVLCAGIVVGFLAIAVLLVLGL